MHHHTVIKKEIFIYYLDYHFLVNIMRREIILFAIYIFLIGWVSNSAYSEIDYFISNYEPASDRADSGILGTEYVLRDKPSPADRIPKESINVNSDEVIIDIKNPRWSKFKDTKSMDPVLDKGAHGIHIVPDSPSEIIEGDIIAYKPKTMNGTIIHRVIKIGHDDKGIYYILKGDNNPSPDPHKVRFEQVERVLVAIIY